MIVAPTAQPQRRERKLISRPLKPSEQASYDRLVSASRWIANEEWAAESFCMVATKECKKEASVALITLRAHHPWEPVHVVCDKETKQHLKRLNLDFIVFHDIITQKTRDAINARDDVKAHRKRNPTYHDPGAILLKMEAIRRAMSQHRNTLFIDSDIVFSKTVRVPMSHAGIAFSPHHNPPGREQASLKFGHFNAGYVFVADPKFADEWERRYLTDSQFFEQGCMNDMATEQRIPMFSKWHNVGFWRADDEGNAGVDPDKVFSWHVHLDPEIQAKLPPVHGRRNDRLRGVALSSILQSGADVYAKVCDELGIPKRVLFCHYGKAGGAWVDSYLKQNCFKHNAPIFEGYITKGRGWTDLTDEEFDAAINTKAPVAYIHQHHVNLSHEQVLAAKENGWFTFSFFRSPESLISSLYFWGRKEQEKRGQNDVWPRGMDAPDERLIDLSLPFDDFLQFCLTEQALRDRWVLPPWADILDYSDLFSDEAFIAFMGRVFKRGCRPPQAMNTSNNPGYASLKASGDVAHQTHLRLISDPDYLRFHHLTSPSQ